MTGVEVDADRVAGVRLADGGRVPAGTVLSSLGALPTLRLAGAEHFDAETCRRVRAIRAEGVTARVELELAGPVEIPGLDPSLRGARLVLAPSVDAVERAFDPVKYGLAVARPRHRGLAGAGAAGRAPLGNRPVRAGRGRPRRGRPRRAGRAGAASCRASEPAAEPVVLPPSDIERITGAPGGHWHHGEIALDQLLTLRPANGLAQYATGLPGLYLCGAGAHPGGDVTGLAGRNAALAALAEMLA